MKWLIFKLIINYIIIMLLSSAQLFIIFYSMYLVFLLKIFFLIKYLCGIRKSLLEGETSK